ncbi:MAG: hypothetical protein OEY05_13120 [Paracoccaceae bacterium]|jgi:hypothetical protein|nr:hypothetical protein [Paracoccaceae bacterium]
MTEHNHSAFETFLVEDVILTLGNLRGSLAWLNQSETVETDARQRAWLDRIDRQIETLEERARHMIGRMYYGPENRGTTHATKEEPAYSPPVPLSSVADVDLGTSPIFRSRRATYP